MIPVSAPCLDAGITFLLCNSALRDANLRERLDELMPQVQAASDAFEEVARVQRLHETPTGNPFAPQITNEQLIKTYTERMVDGPGRPVYDAIFSLCRTCPLCAHREVKTLDHFLPKAPYPVLSVVPLNLIPSCTDCNKGKQTAVPRAASEVLLHPY